MDEVPTKPLPKMEGTPQDQDDMTRMGKIQEFKVLRIWFVLVRHNCFRLTSSKRNFRPLAALSFSAVLQATWEFILM